MRIETESFGRPFSTSRKTCWTIHEPTAAIVALVREYEDDPSTMVDAWMQDDGSAYLAARGSRRGEIKQAIDEAHQDEEATPEPATIAVGTHATALAPGLAGLGHVVDGQTYKPDAMPDKRGACERCGRRGVWISGAGAYLCAAHQDDY